MTKRPPTTITRHALACVLFTSACLLGLALVFGSAPALAAKTRLSTSFGGQGSADGLFEKPAGVAVGEASVSKPAEYVYVVDRGDNRVEQFSAATGAFIAAWGWGVSDGKAEYEVCTSGCGAGIAGSGAGQLDSPQAIAVDNSANPLDPSAGDVYVANTADNAIEKFGPDGEYIGQVQETTAGSPFASELYGVAVDPNGELWVYLSGKEIDNFSDAAANEFISTRDDEFGTNPGFAVDSEDNLYVIRGSETVAKLTSSGAVISEEVDPESATAAAVDLATGEVYIDNVKTVGVFSSSLSFVERFGGTYLEPNGYGGGIAVSSATNKVYVADATTDIVDVFTPPVPLPTVSIEAATGVEKEKGGVIVATLNGRVDPEEEAVTECYFEYGPSLPSGKTAPCEPLAAEIVAGKEFVNVHATVSSLLLSASYVYRLVAANKNGPTSSATNAQFNTPAAVEGVGGCSVPDAEDENEGAALHGSLEPLGEPAGWYFEYGETTAYGLRTSEETSESAGQVTPAVKIANLKPYTTYHCRLVAHNAYGTTDGADGEFMTYGPLVLEGQSFEKVGSIDATVRAVFDPRGLRGTTLASTYYFEYGPTAEYGLRTQETSVGAGKGTVAALAHLNGLQSDAEYHFRIVATDARGTVDGPDATFTTFSTIGSGLPDDRIYEMVSPPEDNNADIYVPESSEEGGGSGNHLAEEGVTITQHPFQVSPEGNAVVYVGDPSFGGNGDIGELGGNNYLATRTAEGWKASSIMPPVKYVEYRGFSSNLSVGVFDAGGSFDKTPLSEEAPGDGYNVIYRHTLSDDNDSYQPLFTKTPRNRGPEEFGFDEEETLFSEQYRPTDDLYAGASADFSHILFEVNAALTPEAADPGREKDDLYEWVDGRLSSVDVLPGGEPAPNATFGGYQPEPESVNGFEKMPDLSHVISADGSRVFWTDLATGDLYVRENGTTTVQVDATHGPEPGGGGNFQTASSDGSKVFFTDCKRLTADSTAVFSSGCNEAGRSAHKNAALSGNDLYEYDVESGELTDLTVDHNASDALGANVQGVIGASEDGEYVYFIADGVLTEGENAEGREPAAGDPNLYLSRDGQTTFIATLDAESDNPPGPPGGTVAGDWVPTLGRRTAEVTPDGQGVVFVTTNSFTGYHNAGFREVYVYDAQSGKLACASCLPTGEAPTAESYLPISGASNATFQLRWISEDGSRVFFNSAAALVAHATSGAMNVYEWERDGAGSCRDPRDCIYLLSGGTSPQGSYLVGASASGDDVFFVTRAQLASQDGSEAYNLYDAHVGGVAPPSPPECSGTGCQGVPLAPTAFEAPASATFTGLGNFPPPAPATAAKPKTAAQLEAANLAKARKACRAKKSKGKRAGCEAKARKKYGSSKAEKSNRRAA